MMCVCAAGRECFKLAAAARLPGGGGGGLRQAAHLPGQPPQHQQERLPLPAGQREDSQKVSILL